MQNKKIVVAMFALGYRKQHLFKIFTRNIMLRIHLVVTLLITIYQTAEMFIIMYISQLKGWRNLYLLEGSIGFNQ